MTPQEKRQRLRNNGCVFVVALTALWIYGMALLIAEIIK